MGDACQLAPPPVTAEALAAVPVPDCPEPGIDIASAAADVLTNGTVLVTARVNAACTTPIIMAGQEGLDAFHEVQGAPGGWVYLFYDEEPRLDESYRYHVHATAANGLEDKEWTNTIELDEAPDPQPEAMALAEQDGAIAKAGEAPPAPWGLILVWSLAAGVAWGMVLVRRRIDK